eukprot:gnl/Dysnectes_brevis/7007_a11361_472.p1 GENE.gnl/Dysnectes_brevis/7007_a11361_472~~gnl/Dysnectes_brevis/7007_a11361_472.p1  ORF type:complete len:261 (-),score=35.51 gnl/Dysnectes_brevis/7007_a11361_472:46-786(-)
MSSYAVDLHYLAHLLNPQHSQAPQGSFATVLLNYKLPSYWKSSIAMSDISAAADGGANHIVAHLPIDSDSLDAPIPLPSCVVGDFDSIEDESRRLLARYGVDLVSAPDQNRTDSQKAYDELQRRSGGCIGTTLVLGAVGGRLDHTLNNISMACSEGPHLHLHGDGNIVLVLQAGTTTIEAPSDLLGSLGIVPLGGITHVRSDGLRWELDDSLSWGGLVSCSNELAGDTLSIDTSGQLLLTFHVKDQ